MMNYMVIRCDLEFNRRDIYSNLMQITGRRGVVDLWALYFWSVKDDLQISLDVWEGIRFVKDIIAYWDRVFVLTLMDKFPIISLKEIIDNGVELHGNSYRVTELLSKKLLDEYRVILFSSNDRQVDTIIFPVKSKKGISILSLKNNLITNIDIIEELENFTRSPKECFLSFNYLDIEEKFFFMRKSGKIYLVVCTTDKNQLIERIKLISLKIV